MNQLQQLNRLGMVSGVASAIVIVAQPAFAQGIAVTNVQLQKSDRGLELILETPTGKQPETFRTTYGETLIIDLINTQLQGEGFVEKNPASGIASVEVVQQYANTVRVKLVGTETVPTAQIKTTGQGIALNVNTDITTAEEPAPPPAPTPTPQQPEMGQQEPIELVVTATRTEQREEEVPRSVTVIDREEIEEQANFTQNLGDILGKLVPGFGPPSFQNRTNVQTLRGRQAQILVDGVPLRTNGAVDIQTRFITPSAIERIEVVRGPTAVFGGEAKGGVINIITREPTEEQFEATTKIGVGAALGGLEGDSFSNQQEQTIAFNQERFDLTFTFSREDTGSFFDAEGDRVAPNNATLDKTNTLNFLGKFGIDFTEEQRLQLTVNHTRDRREDLDFVAEASEEEGGKAVAVEEDLSYEDDTEPKINNTIVNLNYTHEDLIGSEIQAQAYYRDTFNRTRTPNRRFVNFAPIGTVVNSENDNETWGGRLQADTSLGEDSSLLWGVDYESQKAGDQTFNQLDMALLDEQGIVRKVGEIPILPEFDFNKLGLFAQAQWQLSDRLRFSGGLRHERFTLNLEEDFNNVVGSTIEAGEENFNETLFNLGLVYNFTDEINGFAKFSQGFSAPPFGDVISVAPDGFAIGSNFDDLQPEKVDEYEIGLRGNWENINASLSAFYNYSALGANLVVPSSPNEISSLARAPQRVYGVEATLDWQIEEDWQVGGTLSWNEGDSDNNDDGDFQPLSTRQIQPLKITAYLENQTTPGWNNRLQLLLVGSRDRAFDEEVDPSPVDSYVVLDYISSIKLGQGTLQIGLENLLDNQYLPVSSQTSLGGNLPQNAFAATGRRVTINYSLTW
ncbi:MAG: TonB-dependent receptor [Cyanobacteria bacterium]|nr:TonB-dependent receptor [Cyanobacteria bacterium GSL.Bin1]